VSTGDISDRPEVYSGADEPVGRLLDAMLAVAGNLSLPAVLRKIVESACTLAGAKYGALGVLGEDEPLAEFVAVGVDDATVRAIGHTPEGKGILGLIILDPRPLRLPDLTRHPDSAGFPPGHPPMRSFLGVPIRVRDEVFGNLYLTEKAGGGDFTAEDEHLVVSLAAAAGEAIENVTLHEKLQAVVLLEDRERIARDLHDKVIQRLFATGMALQATERLVVKPDVGLRIQQAVDELDETIREIRATIFALQTPVRRSLRREVLARTTEAGEILGFEPTVRFEGPVDSVVPDAVGGELLTVLQESLSNAVRHARARRVDVTVAVGADILLRVADDGVGFDPSQVVRGHGLRNMRLRAEAMGGGFTVEPRPDGGTILGWHVPLG